MNGHDARLVPAAVAAWSGSLLAVAGPAPRRWAIVGLAVVLVIGAAGLRRRRPGEPAGRTRAAAAAAVVAAVAGSAAMATAVAAADARAWAPVGDRIVLEGRVLEVRGGAGSTWVELSAASWGREAEGSRAAASGAVGVALDDAAGGVPGEAVVEAAVGDTLVVAGRVVSGATPRRAALVRDAVVLARDPPAGWSAAVVRARSGFALAASGLPQPTRGLVHGMVTGDDAAVPAAQLAELRVSGLAHLTAVSGAHFAIVAGAVVAVARRARAARAVIAVAVVGSALALASVVDGGGSVARAVGTAAVAAAALAVGRPSRAVPALAAVVTVLVVVSPRLASDLGFALSVAAVLAIGVVAPALAVPLSRRLHGWLAHAIAMTVAAQAACLPLLASIGADVGPWAVAANAVAAPFAAPVTLLGLAALVVAPAAPVAAAACAQLASWAAWPIALAARAFAAAPGGDLRWPGGVAGAVLALVAAAPLALAGVAPRLALGAHLGLIALVVAPGLLPPALGGAARGWMVAACDVGQGDALVVSAGGAVVMVDAGPPGDGSGDCLRRLGVRAVDLLILTHDHDDHVGGVEELTRRVAVRDVWLPPGASAATVADARGAAHARPAPDAGTRTVLGGVAVTVLQAGPVPASRDGTALNDSSIVTLIEASSGAGGLATLALGDLELDGQARLLSGLATTSAALSVDVLKVAHHGSAVQDPRLVAAVASRVAVISAGEGNRHGHPAPATLALLAGTPVLRTDLCGDILLAPVGGGVGLVRPCPSGVAG
ncbi:ComEC/Rec2 family competence protein [Demequina sp. SYSU T00068]|uniref:ComEC/Rec2 family competence protein n=1 Tax=Demequina lignilytica TaxID=3051663 RepID=UPI0026124E4F|nr:ComEC/Rec2 family competence protein [Demequina sp. SYSU T00068]MDN4489751.1 ComEC/Rec2 family competence protein [Demequina sp. SYSU T00068]